MNQREGVFAAVEAVVGEIHGKVTLNDNQKKEVYALVFTAFKHGEIVYKGGIPAEPLRKYIPGLVNNWLRKDKALNGGVKYKAKAPGSRAGAGDAGLKAMKQLLAETTNEEDREVIEMEIELRQEALAKPKAVINIEALPPLLRKFIK